MFFILEGEGELRFGDERYPIRKHDVIACPPGGPEVAHQIINTGATTMRYLALSTRDEADICEYPCQINAQTYLEEMYGRDRFIRDDAEFLHDNIPHVPRSSRDVTGLSVQRHRRP